MNKFEIRPKKHTSETDDEIKEIFKEEQNRGSNKQPSKKPDLDYYDKRPDRNTDDSKVPYQGIFGKFKKD